MPGLMHLQKVKYLLKVVNMDGLTI